MTLRDLLHRKSTHDDVDSPPQPFPDVTIIRTTTDEQTELKLPAVQDNDENHNDGQAPSQQSPEHGKSKRSFFGSHRHRSASSEHGRALKNVPDATAEAGGAQRTPRKLSGRLARLGISRSFSTDGSPLTLALSIPHAPEPIPAPLSPGLVNPALGDTLHGTSRASPKGKKEINVDEQVDAARREVEWEDYAARLALATEPVMMVMTSSLDTSASIARSRRPSPIITTIAEADTGQQSQTSPTTLRSGTPTSLLFPSTSLLLHRPSPTRTLSAQSHFSSSRPSSPLSPNPIIDPRNDEEVAALLQEAIRLHESGALIRSTALFATLADPLGANNTMSQVMYGLALRHGWGCEKNEEEALSWLKRAARGSAEGILPLITPPSTATEIAKLTGKVGIACDGIDVLLPDENEPSPPTIKGQPRVKKPQDAMTKTKRNELVLAIFELANCYRHGWGTPKDPQAARTFYEAAANLKDVDALEEIGWCYLEGFGGSKDKFKAAQYLRLAEQYGKKTVGNSWIWKPKYDQK